MVQGLKPFKPGKTIAGLTGVYGTGKSTVSRLFEELGAFRVDSDQLAHEALMKGSSVYGRLAETFKNAVDPKSGDLDRKILGAVIFEDPDKRKFLESVVHPYVFQRIAEEVSDAEQPVAILEIPLLFETGFDKYCSPNIVVKADLKVITKRLEEKGIDPKAAEERWNAQLPQEEKLKRADIVIDNSKSLDETKNQVQNIWKNIFLKGAIQHHAKRENN